jgi:hypothetical protein
VTRWFGGWWWRCRVRDEWLSGEVVGRPSLIVEGGRGRRAVRGGQGCDRQCRVRSESETKGTRGVRWQGRALHHRTTHGALGQFNSKGSPIRSHQSNCDHTTLGAMKTDPLRAAQIADMRVTHTCHTSETHLSHGSRLPQPPSLQWHVRARNGKCPPKNH